MHTTGGGQDGAYSSQYGVDNNAPILFSLFSHRIIFLEVREVKEVREVNVTFSHLDNTINFSYFFNSLVVKD